MKAQSHPAARAPAAQVASNNCEIAQRIQQLLLSIELEIAPPSATIKSGTPLNIPLQIRAWSKGRPVSALPLSCRFARGLGAIDARAWTGADGRATAVLHRVESGAPTQTAVVQIDLSAFASTAMPFDAPFATFELAVARPQVYFSCEGEPALVAQLEGRLRALLRPQQNRHTIQLADSLRQCLRT